MSTAQSQPATAFEGWAILELMGHRRLAGYVQDVSMFGTAMCRIDVPAANGSTQATQFYSGASIYCLTPCTEQTAREVAASCAPAPVTRWQLPPAVVSPRIEEDNDEDDEDDEDEFR